jgi:DMSO/TMAO reductase YedYZ molybdopterin-dependent catalytic subunit
MQSSRKIPTFYWEYKGHTPPDIKLEGYTIKISGGVKNPITIPVADLSNVLPFINAQRRFYCVNGWTMEDVWGGYWLSDLIALVEPQAEYLRVTSLGGYEDTSKLADLIDGGAMLATHMGGAPLAPKRGFPIRLLIFDMYQFKGVKSVSSLEVTDEYRPGTWQKVGYRDASIQAYPHLDIKTGERLMPEPAVLKTVSLGQVKNHE